MHLFKYLFSLKSLFCCSTGRMPFLCNETILTQCSDKCCNHPCRLLQPSNVCRSPRNLQKMEDSPSLCMPLNPRFRICNCCTPSGRIRQVCILFRCACRHSFLDTSFLCNETVLTQCSDKCCNHPCRLLQPSNVCRSPRNLQKMEDSPSLCMPLNPRFRICNCCTPSGRIRQVCI